MWRWIRCTKLFFFLLSESENPLAPVSAFFRLDTLNPSWTNKGLKHLIYDRDISEFGRPERPQVLEIPDWLKSAYQPRKRTTKIYRLYLYYCYQLGILPKGMTYHPVSPQLRADLRHLDDVDRQTRYLASHKIETVEELLADRSEKEAQLESLVDQRTKLQNKIRQATPERKILLRKEKAEVTARITALRKDIRDSKEIEQRSLEIQDTLDRAFEAEHTGRNRKEHAYLHENRSNWKSLGEKGAVTWKLFRMMQRSWYRCG